MFQSWTPSEGDVFFLYFFFYNLSFFLLHNYVHGEEEGK